MEQDMKVQKGSKSISLHFL